MSRQTKRCLVYRILSKVTGNNGYPTTRNRPPLVAWHTWQGGHSQHSEPVNECNGDFSLAVFIESCFQKDLEFSRGPIRLSCSLPPGNDGGSIPPYPVLTIERQQNLWLSLATPTMSACARQVPEFSVPSTRLMLSVAQTTVRVLSRRKSRKAGTRFWPLLDRSWLLR